ncbi:hypothetical protein APHAL10511_007318 [Amanita phalloides]|nr:hypothetical protein APHAL10511_007318 [Amanita phalloides]
MPRLTKRKRSQKKRPVSDDSDDYNAPTADEWATLPTYQKFVVTEGDQDRADDEDREEHVFKMGDVVLLLPQTSTVEEAEVLEDCEYWVAKIRDIRSRVDGSVWARVQWYYSPSDVACIVKSFKTNVCGKYERIFSDHYDYVHVDSFSGQTAMTRLKSDDVIQEYIGEEEFYCRYNFEHLARRLLPKQNAFACPTCAEPYSPDNSDHTRLMHFCPRPSCRKYYHERCLKALKRQPRSVETLQMITTWPDTDKKESLLELLSPTHVQRKEDSSVVPDFLGSLPDELVKVAEQPIVRGAAFRNGGVGGNVSYVVSARRMMYGVLQGSTIPEDWFTHVNIATAVVSIKMGAKKKTISAFVCPKCNSVI